MTHRIVSVEPIKDLCIHVGFQNGVEKIYDMRKLYPIFPQFETFETNMELFKQVQVDIGGYGIFWNDDLDLHAEEIWENGITRISNKEIDAISALAVSLIEARATIGITQKQLSEATGIYQADISKIERGLANPSVATLKRLADGLGLKLKISFE